MVLVGRATRLARFTSDLAKTYVGTIRFGSETSTDDAGGKVTAADDGWRTLDDAAVRRALAEVAARPTQVPPAVSAKKVAGVRAYKLARRGAAPDLAPVAVSVTRLEATRLALPDVEVEVECSTGTYVRALARDVGRALGTRAHLAVLRRVAIGAWDVSGAVPLAGATAASLRTALRPLREALAHLPVLAVDAPAAERVRHGRPVPGEREHEGAHVVEHEGEVLAVAEYRDGAYAPLVVLVP